jgi:hypothetical protein
MSDLLLDVKGRTVEGAVHGGERACGVRVRQTMAVAYQAVTAAALECAGEDSSDAASWWGARRIFMHSLWMLWARAWGVETPDDPTGGHRRGSMRVLRPDLRERHYELR